MSVYRTIGPLVYRKKWKQWIFQKLLQPVTWKLVGADILLNVWWYVSIEGQGHFLTLAQGHVHTKIQTWFSQKLLYLSEPNFVCKLSGTRKLKSDDMMLVTWPRWQLRPYMVKTLQKSSHQNQRADFHKTWYVASGTPAHHKLFKWWPWSDLDLFYGKFKFGNICFSIGKSENSGFQKLLQPVTWKLVAADI